MIIRIDDSTNSAKPLYYQSLVLLYLPCEKFGEGDNENSLDIKAFVKNDVNYAFVKLKVDDRISEHSLCEAVDLKKYAQMKNLIGRTFLRAAERLFGHLPPWGISTGVKPVKLARIFVNSLGADNALKVLTDDYMISYEKARLAVSACLYEDKLMRGMGESPCSLYISIPFCPTKCNYCSFVSCTTPRLLSLIPDYLKRIEEELLLVKNVIEGKHLNLKSIYIGGGTPAILTDLQIGRLLSVVNDCFEMKGVCEFTFEAGRPDCITREKLLAVKNGGVGRISINTQSANDEILKSIGRDHLFSDYLKAMDAAREVGFSCINTDLIAGLPGESPESFCESVRRVEAVLPENITVHAFTLKKSSSYRIDGGKSFSVDNLSAIEMTDYASQYLCERAYSPYYIYRQKNTVANLDNVGYSRPGFEGIYNVVMMGEYHTVFGVGAGSVTKIVRDSGNKVDRLFSPKYPYEFLDREKYKGFDVDKCIELI